MKIFAKKNCEISLKYGLDMVSEVCRSFACKMQKIANVQIKSNQKIGKKIKPTDLNIFHFLIFS